MVVLQNGKPVKEKELKCVECSALLVQARNTRVHNDALMIEHNCKGKRKLFSFTILWDSIAHPPQRRRQ